CRRARPADRQSAGASKRLPAGSRASAQTRRRCRTPRTTQWKKQLSRAWGSVAYATRESSEKPERRADLSRQGLLVDQRGRGDVLQRRSRGIENDDLVGRGAAGLLPGQNLAQLRVHIAARHQAARNGVVQLTHLFALVENIDNQLVSCEQLRVDLLLLRAVGAHGGDEDAAR